MYVIMKYFVLFASVILQNVYGQQFEGDFCTISSSQTSGICKLISLCPQVIQALQQTGAYPQNCGFKDHIPIVCCPNGNSIQLDDTTTTSTTTRRSITTTTTRATTRATVTVSSSTSFSGISKVGDKSKQKCLEYGKYVYQQPPVATFNTDDTSLLEDTCALVGVTNIVGGTPALPREFPHMALIGFDSDDGIQWNCGGSLISEKYVLSAAHCVYHRQYGSAKHILLGELDLSTNREEASPEQIPIRNILTHPEYIYPSQYNDIALFELEHEAKLNSFVRPACLTIDSTPLSTTETAIASGWGRVSTLGDVSPYLQKVTLNMFSNTECNYTYRRSVGPSLKYGIVESTQVCAGSRNSSRDTCQGDSGGPLQRINPNVYCTYNILGITSFGKACGSVNIAAVYTRVSHYIKWIEDNVWP